MSQDSEIKKLFGSESEDEAPESAADVLKQAGLEDSEDEQEHSAGAAAGQDGQASAHESRPAFGDEALEDEEQHDRPIGPPETWQVPLIPRPPNQMHVLNFKSLLEVDSQPFSADAFDIKSEGFLDESGRSRVTRASVLNRIRWRFTDGPDKDTGQIQKESNARFVRWSDGSLQLLLGEEVLDVSEQALDDHNMALCVLHTSSRVLQSQGPIASRFIVRPHGINSQLRRNQTAALAPTTAPTGTKEDTVIRDHETLHQANVAQADSRLRLEARQDKIKRKSRSNYSSFSRDQFLSRGPGLTAEALETGDDYDDYDDEDEEDDYGARGGGDEQDEEEQERRLMAAKKHPSSKAERVIKRKTYIDDEDDFALSDDDPEDMPAAPPQGKRRLVLDDDDDE